MDLKWGKRRGWEVEVQDYSWYVMYIKRIIKTKLNNVLLESVQVARFPPHLLGTPGQDVTPKDQSSLIPIHPSTQEPFG